VRVGEDDAVGVDDEARAHALADAAALRHLLLEEAAELRRQILEAFRQAAAGFGLRVEGRSDVHHRALVGFGDRREVRQRLTAAVAMTAGAAPLRAGANRWAAGDRKAKRPRSRRALRRRAGRWKTLLLSWNCSFSAYPTDPQRAARFPNHAPFV
jgi:hypothetical protein